MNDFFIFPLVQFSNPNTLLFYFALKTKFNVEFVLASTSHSPTLNPSSKFLPLILQFSTI
jgi:hypothetical protein